MSARREGDAKRNPPGLLACGLALLVGALLVQLLPRLPPRGCDIALLASASSVLIAVLVLQRIESRQTSFPRRRESILLLILMASFGWTALRADLAMQARLPHALEGRDLVVTGTIADLPQAQAESTRFEFDVERASLD